MINFVRLSLKTYQPKRPILNKVRADSGSSEISSLDTLYSHTPSETKLGERSKDTFVLIISVKIVVDMKL